MRDREEVRNGLSAMQGEREGASKRVADVKRGEHHDTELRKRKGN